MKGQPGGSQAQLTQVAVLGGPERSEDAFYGSRLKFYGEFFNFFRGNVIAKGAKVLRLRSKTGKGSGQAEQINRNLIKALSRQKIRVCVCVCVYTRGTCV